MTAFNVVRFRVKPGRDQEFLDAHKTIGATWVGLARANIIKTGDRSYCIIAEWKDMDACIQARPNMISTLDSFSRCARRPRRRSRRHRSGGGSGRLIVKIAAVMPSSRMSERRGSINALAERYRLPAIYPCRHFATDGGLISYGLIRSINGAERRDI
jgi:hypothetical protein